MDLKAAYTDPAAKSQLIRFLCVGLLNTIVGYGSFFILVNYMNYLIALLIAHLIGVTHSYLWNNYWIFKVNRLDLIEFLRFNVVYAAVYVVNAVMLFIGVEGFGVDPRLAQLVILPFTTLISFAGQKFWTFKECKQ
jgi:putative flippase GtrA